MGVEIERKFLVKKESADMYINMAESGKLEFEDIEQAYLTTNPVIRVRRSNDDYILTYKGKGSISREEYNLALNEESYKTLLSKADGNIIAKRRILIPYDKYTIELDIFRPPFDDYIVAEVEFESLDEAEKFVKPDWFLNDVSEEEKYRNSYMSRVRL